MSFLPESFFEFTSPKCNRSLFIQKQLESSGIKFDIIKLGSSNHIYVQFPSHAYNPAFKIKTVLVHYDRVENSPGANDNSAAVFQVLSWAKRLASSQQTHNVRIFLTDGEELGKESVSEQGAFAIASKFKKLGITEDDVYVFDCCGRGDVLVVSQAGHINNGSFSFKKKLDSLFDRTYKLARLSAPQSWITAPVSYSDNAGFIACGIPAVALTVLPQNEATGYITKGIIPLSWQLIHTERDNIQSLDSAAFILMQKVLDTLALQKTPV